jgi:hypothetical protein
MSEAILSSETSVHTGARPRNIPEDGILLVYLNYITALGATVEEKLYLKVSKV